MNINDLVSERVAELKKKTFGELATLPSCQTHRERIGKKKVAITVWKDEIDQDELRVVVQAYQHRFLGIGRMCAEGFRISKQGFLTEVSRPELYEFQ